MVSSHDATSPCDLLQGLVAGTSPIACADLYVACHCFYSNSKSFTVAADPYIYIHSQTVLSPSFLFFKFLVRDHTVVCLVDKISCDSHLHLLRKTCFENFAEHLEEKLSKFSFVRFPFTHGLFLFAIFQSKIM